MKDFVKILPDINQAALKEGLETHYHIGSIPHKYFYWDFYCSSLWCQLVASSEFKTHDQSVRSLNLNYQTIHEYIISTLNGPYDVVSLGIGAGDDDIVILGLLSQYVAKTFPKREFSFFPADISMHLIHHSLEKLQRADGGLLQNACVAILNVDFFRFYDYKQAIDKSSDNPRLFCLLGSTLGNYDEYRLVQQIHSTMTTEDYLLLGVDCPVEKCQKDDILNRYKDAPSGYEFLLGPLQSIGKFKEPVFTNVSRSMQPKFAAQRGIMTEVPESKSIYHELPAKFVKGQRRQIHLNKSTKYSLQHLTDWLNKWFGLQLVLEPQLPDTTQADEGAYYVLLLLKKTNILEAQSKRVYREQLGIDKKLSEVSQLCRQIGERAENARLQEAEIIKSFANRLSRTIFDFPPSVVEIDDILGNLKSLIIQPSAEQLDKIVTKYYRWRQDHERQRD